MSGIMGVHSYGMGTILELALLGVLVFWFVQDVTQKKWRFFTGAGHGARKSSQSF